MSEQVPSPERLLEILRAAEAFIELAKYGMPREKSDFGCEARFIVEAELPKLAEDLEWALNPYGVPFKSGEHRTHLSHYQVQGWSPSIHANLRNLVAHFDNFQLKHRMGALEDGRPYEPQAYAFIDGHIIEQGETLAPIVKDVVDLKRLMEPLTPIEPWGRNVFPDQVRRLAEAGKKLQIQINNDYRYGTRTNYVWAGEVELADCLEELADALHGLRGLESTFFRKWLNLERAVKQMDIGLNSILTRWNWQWIRSKIPGPERHAYREQAKYDWSNRVEKPLMEAALSIKRDPSVWDADADVNSWARKALDAGIEPTMSGTSALEHWPKLLEAWENTPILGPVPVATRLEETVLEEQECRSIYFAAKQLDADLEAYDRKQKTKSDLSLNSATTSSGLIVLSQSAIEPASLPSQEPVIREPPKRKRGRPKGESANNQDIYNKWKSGGYRTYADFALKYGLSELQVRCAVDSARKRNGKNAP